MRIVPVQMWNHTPSADNGDGLLVRSKNPVLAKIMDERRRALQPRHNQKPDLLETIALESRVIVVEGISGSGKDTFQSYLGKMLKDRDIYDYSEGEVLHSWKHLQIDGIAKIRIEFMKLFVN